MSSKSDEVIDRILDALKTDAEASPLADDLRGLWKEGKWNVQELEKVASARRSRLGEQT